MKKTFALIFLIFGLLSSAQVPILKLSSPVGKNQNWPDTLNKNEICIIYEINGGWSAYDFFTYYFIKNDGKITAYRQEKAKSYLKDKVSDKATEKIAVEDELKQRISKLINSNQLNELLKFKQEDFKIKTSQDPNTIPPPCIIHDASGYKLTFIQNNKQSLYSYYAPQYHYDKCTNKLINKPVLKTFIDVLELLSGKSYY
ncbi:hypothetical protein [Epilithonimonas mollis]|uniref:Uncharacterized protein n=1 Tax=Epilithonimonas mollis TaxID=216903 RepID=A0A1M6NVX4_9FLAO|nr:hypothetical protein [Epilithonimonas mollis]SHJ99909.1 hypothetical protein SAMN05444371_0692 [Epilithonimonas mollis]